MITPAVLGFLQLSALAVAALGLVALAALVIWAIITAILWVVAHRRGEDAPQPLAADGWFDALERQA
jgi:hypothetical protein